MIMIIRIIEFNKLTPENVAARLAQTNLTSKSDIADLRQILMINWKIWVKMLLQIKQNMYLYKMN